MTKNGKASCGMLDLAIKNNIIMAKQKGILKLSGTIGDLSFYKTQDGFLAREKGGVDKERIKNDPNFQRTRENGQEFGRAGTSGRVLRTAFRMLIQNAKDRLLTSRLTKEMVHVLQTDTLHPRGQRTVLDGDQSKLIGFDFNQKSKLASTFYAPYVTAIDRTSGTMKVSFPEIIPEEVVTSPSGVTHFSIVSGAAIINYEDELFEVSTLRSDEVLIGNEAQTPPEQSHTLTAASTGDIYLVVGLEFVQIVNDVRYALTGGYNPLCIVAIDQHTSSES